ncbi:hypothetical protein B0J14DRAFT_704048 [Halenospora varia]|nr:hypothetical protein B0J14DRAFT_704048 [Halenospora varia]
MDPLSITAGVVALLTACLKVGASLKEFHEGSAIADVKVKGLLFDVESFTIVLKTIKDTLDEEKVQASLQGRGHIGNHYTNLSASIKDGQNTLTELQTTLDKVNKSVSVLNGPRKHLRLKGAAEEIVVFQLQIRSCRDTLHLSLQAVALWNQVTLQESNDKILPNLNDLHHSIRSLATDINFRMMNLQNLVESNTRNDSVQTLTNLKKCVQSAATVVSSASTALGIDDTDRFSVAHQSEFGDLFPPEPNEAMTRWISSNTVYEFEGDQSSETTVQEQRPAFGKGIGPDEARDSDHPDSEAELEIEIIQEFFKRGRKKLNEGEFEGAERLLRSCLTRIADGSISTSKRTPKTEITDLLIKCCCAQEKLDDARFLLMEKITLGARGATRGKSNVLQDMIQLVELLLLQGAYSEALLYGRKALKGYRRLDSSSGINAALDLLIRVCHADGNIDEEEAYRAILSNSTTIKSPPQPSTNISATQSQEISHLVDPNANSKHKANRSSPSTEVTVSPDQSGELHHSKSKNEARQAKGAERAVPPPPPPSRSRWRLSSDNISSRTALEDRAVQPAFDQLMSKNNQSLDGQNSADASRDGIDVLPASLLEQKAPEAVGDNEPTREEEPPKIMSNYRDSTNSWFPKPPAIPNIRLSFLTANDQAKFEQLFKSAAGGEATLSGDKSKDILLRSRLDSSILSQIWMLADTTRSGELYFPEFALAMDLCNLKIVGKTLPSVLPPLVEHEVSNMIHIIDLGTPLEGVLPGCAGCEEPLSFSEGILQLNCGHISHKACYNRFMKGFESVYEACPTCNTLPREEKTILPTTEYKVEKHWLPHLESMHIASPPVLRPLTPTTLPTKHRKILIIGDKRVGKSAFVMAASRGTGSFDFSKFSATYKPTGERTTLASFSTSQAQYSLTMVEIGSAPIRMFIVPAAIPNVDVILICFSVATNNVLKDIRYQWQEIALRFKDVPYILVELQADNHIVVGPDTFSRQKPQTQEICAFEYKECSAKNNQGIHQVLESAMRAVDLAEIKKAEQRSLVKTAPAKKRGFRENLRIAFEGT